MPFFEKRIEVKDIDEYRRLIGVKPNQGADQPHVLLIDHERGISFYELGGRGEMPASTGAPPNQYVLVVNGVVYRIDLREKMIMGSAGGIGYCYVLESIYWPSNGLLGYEEIFLIIREVLLVSAIAGAQKRKSKLKVDEINLDTSGVNI